MDRCLEGVGLLGASKALDAATTAVGLRYVPGVVEANPVPAAAFGALGVVAGIVVSSLLTVVGVALVTEVGAGYLRRHDDAPAWSPTAARVVDYGPLSVVFVAAALHDAGVVVHVLLAG